MLLIVYVIRQALASKKLEQKIIEVEHKDLSLLLYQLKRRDIVVVNKEFIQRVKLTLTASTEKFKALDNSYRN